jgi:TrmH family RNA methyltransferase
LITSLSNPLVRQVRLLSQRKVRKETGRFLVEGLHAVGAALEAGWRIAAVLHAPDLLASEFAEQVVQRASSEGIRTEAVSRAVLTAVAGKDNPQGLLAIVEQKHHGLEQIVVSTLAVALHEPQDPGNVGAILRTLEAVGGEALFLLDGGVDPYHPTAVRASMGALFWVPAVSLSAADFFTWRNNRDLHLVGSSAHGGADYRALAYRKPCVLVLGNEQKGLPASLRDACDAVVRIPMRGHASSLNLSAAAAVMLYEIAAAQLNLPAPDGAL